MRVEIIEYGQKNNKTSYIKYKIKPLTPEAIKYLQKNIPETITQTNKDTIILTAEYPNHIYPLQSQEAQNKPSIFIKREEIEMTAYISGVLEDLLC